MGDERVSPPTGIAVGEDPVRRPEVRAGVCPGIDLDHALRLAGELADAQFVRKHELGTGNWSIGARGSGGIVLTWLTRLTVTAPHPTARHCDLIAEMLEATGVGGNLVSDAQLAALAIDHGAALVTFDSDFARFLALVAATLT